MKREIWFSLINSFLLINSVHDQKRNEQHWLRLVAPALIELYLNKKIISLISPVYDRSIWTAKKSTISDLSMICRNFVKMSVILNNMNIVKKLF